MHTITVTALSSFTVTHCNATIKGGGEGGRGMRLCITYSYDFSLNLRNKSQKYVFPHVCICNFLVNYGLREEPLLICLPGWCSWRIYSFKQATGDWLALSRDKWTRPRSHLSQTERRRSLAAFICAWDQPPLIYFFLALLLLHLYFR